MEEKESKTLKEFTPIQKDDALQIRVALRSYGNSEYLDIREYWHPSDKESEIYLPTKKGITLSTGFTLDGIRALRDELTMFLDEEDAKDA